MTRKTEIGYYALLVVLVLGSLRFGQLMWQQQQTLSHLQKQAKQLKHKQAIAKISQQKVKQVEAKGRYWQMYQLQLAGEELAASAREEESLSA